MFKRFKYKSRQLHLIWQNNGQLWKLLITTLWDFLEKNYANRIILTFLRRKTPVPYFQKSAHLPPPLPPSAGSPDRRWRQRPSRRDTSILGCPDTAPILLFTLFHPSQNIKIPHTLILVFSPSHYSTLKFISMFRHQWRRSPSQFLFWMHDKNLHIANFNFMNSEKCCQE